jgi:hypothetical protein
MMRSPASTSFLLPLAFALFIVFWCAISFVISYISGWFALSQHFRRETDPCGEIRSAGPWFYTVYMRGWCHYGGVVRLVAADDAIYASVLAPFRIGHPPLRIPWDEVQVSRTRYLWRRYIELTLGREEQIPMRISERMASNLGLSQRFPAMA